MKYRTKEESKVLANYAAQELKNGYDMRDIAKEFKTTKQNISLILKRYAGKS